MRDRLAESAEAIDLADCVASYRPPASTGVTVLVEQLEEPLLTCVAKLAARGGRCHEVIG